MRVAAHHGDRRRHGREREPLTRLGLLDGRIDLAQLAPRRERRPLGVFDRVRALRFRAAVFRRRAGSGIRIDRLDVWRNGAYAIAAAGKDLQFSSAAGEGGLRPWTVKPVARKSILAPSLPVEGISSEDAEAAPDSEAGDQ